MSYPVGAELTYVPDSVSEATIQFMKKHAAEQGSGYCIDQDGTTYTILPVTHSFWEVRTNPHRILFLGTNLGEVVGGLAEEGWRPAVQLLYQLEPFWPDCYNFMHEVGWHRRRHRNWRRAYKAHFHDVDTEAVMTIVGTIECTLPASESASIEISGPVANSH